MHGEQGNRGTGEGKGRGIGRGVRGVRGVIEGIEGKEIERGIGIIVLFAGSTGGSTPLQDEGWARRWGQEFLGSGFWVLGYEIREMGYER